MNKAEASSISNPQTADESYWHPESSFQDRYITALLFVGSCFYLLLFRDFTTMHSDEGIVLEGAERILRGQVPYRDFFAFYTPGSYYWTALLFRIFWDSILVPRTALVIYGGLLSALGYLLARRVCSRLSSVLAVCLALLVSLPYSFYVQHSWDSSLLAMLTIYCAVRLLESPIWLWPFATGSFAALTVLFEHSKGAGLLLGLLLGIGMLKFGRVGSRFNRAQVLIFAAGLVWPFLITFAYFESVHAIGPMLDGWTWPLYHYSAVNRVNYGYLHLSAPQWNALHSGSWLWRTFAYFVISPVVIVALLPFVVFGVSALQSFRLVRGMMAGLSASYYVLIGVALFGLWLPVAALRPDLAHLIYLTPLFAIGGAWTLDTRDIPLGIFRIARPVVRWYLIGSFAAFGLALLLNCLGAKNIVETQRGVLKSADADTVIPYIQAHLQAGKAIYVYPYQPLYYYLTGAWNPTQFDYLQPGMHTTPQSEQVLQALERDQAAVAVFTPSFRDSIAVSWPRTPLSVIAARDAVADYLLAHYRVCQVLHSGPTIYWYMLLKTLPCPAGSQFAQPAGGALTEH